MFWRRKRRTTGDFAEEIRSHIELEADQLKAGSVSEAEARMTARKTLLDHCIANGRYSRSRAHALHGLFVPVVSIEF